MTAPSWADALVREFGRGAGVEGLSLGESGGAALDFANGRTLRFEWTRLGLAAVVTAPCAGDARSAKAVLSCAHPEARFGARVRAGLRRSAKAGGGCAAVFAVLLGDGEATLPALDAAYRAAWRAADYAEGGGAWA